MNILTATLAAYRAGSEVSGAWAAAEVRFREGKGPVAALRAFAAATGTNLDDEALAVLETALATTCRWLATGVTAAAWVAAHGDDARHVVETAGAALDAALGFAIEVGYTASHYRAQLEAWAVEAEAPR